jgi:hypothetical protein
MNDSSKVVALKKYNVVIPKLINLIKNMNHAQQVRLLVKAEEFSSKERRAYQLKSRCKPASKIINFCFLRLKPKRDNVFPGGSKP